MRLIPITPVRHPLVVVWIYVLWIPSLVQSFASYRQQQQLQAVKCPTAAAHRISHHGMSRSRFDQDRRAFTTVITVTSLFNFFDSFFRPSSAAAQQSQTLSTKNKGPICVIGANGRTGYQCVQGCLQLGIPVRAATRSGQLTADDSSAPSSSSSSLLSSVACDVKDPMTISSAIQGARGVIFAASASKTGGTAAQVDNQGLISVAQACIENNIPHLVIVSSGAVSKPFSPVYLFLNLFGNIMSEKIQGEDAVRNLYRRLDPTLANTFTYTIVRPGGLTEEAPLGASGLELNQGDTKSGRISRTDVAALCIQSMLFPQYTSRATFECYNADTGKPLQSVGLSNLFKAKSDGKEFVSGKERRGNTWETLFQGLEQD